MQVSFLDSGADKRLRESHRQTSAANMWSCTPHVCDKVRPIAPRRSATYAVAQLPEGKFSQKPEKSGFPETTKTEKRALARYGLIFVLETGTYRAKPKFSCFFHRNLLRAFLVQKAEACFLPSQTPVSDPPEGPILGSNSDPYLLVFCRSEGRKTAHTGKTHIEPAEPRTPASG